jgi:hypothetical protein
VAVIEYLSPLWIIKDGNIRVSINGANFYYTDLMKVKLVSTDGSRISYRSINSTTVVYQSPSLVQFDFPSNIFLEKDLVSVSLRFGEEMYFLAEQKLQVYSPIVLDRVRPLYIYTTTD